MRDEGSARREPTGYKVRRALARRQPRPSPRSTREKRTTCRLPLTGSAPYKGRPGRRRRLGGAPGRGTLAKDEPPTLGLVQRGGEVVLRMLANVRQVTIRPVIEGTVAARRLKVVWSGTRSASPSRRRMEPISPSVCRNARRNTARKVSAVRIARASTRAGRRGSC